MFHTPNAPGRVCRVKNEPPLSFLGEEYRRRGYNLDIVQPYIYRGREKSIKSITVDIDHRGAYRRVSWTLKDFLRDILPTAIITGIKFLSLEFLLSISTYYSLSTIMVGKVYHFMKNATLFLTPQMWAHSLR